MNKYFDISLDVVDYFGPDNTFGISSAPLATSYSVRGVLQPPWTHESDVLLSEQCEGMTKIATSCKNLFNPTISKAYMTPNYRTNWLYDIVVDQIEKINGILYGFDIWGIAEPIMYCRFNQQTDAWSARSDQFGVGPVRKLTFMLQLSDENSYEGSDIQLIYGNNKIDNIPRKQGTLTVFPSYMVYGIEKPTSGNHDILIGYFTGKELR